MKGIIKALFPPKCPVCNRVIDIEGDICIDCAKKLDRIVGRRCKKCGCEKKYCKCTDSNKWYERLIAPYYYNDYIKSALLKLKKKGDRRTVAFLSKSIVLDLLDEYKTVVFDCVAAVPMHKRKKRRKGFAHADLLGNAVAKNMNIPFEKDALKQIKLAKPQHLLSAKERQNNVLDVFEANENIVFGKNVLLVDDICTTGATLDACARALVIGGADSVYCVCVAKKCRKNH